MGIEPTSLAWEARVIAIIRRPQSAPFYAVSADLGKSAGRRPGRDAAFRARRAEPGARSPAHQTGQMPNSVSDTAARVTTISSTWTITNSRIGDRSMPPRRGMILRSGSRNGAVS